MFVNDVRGVGHKPAVANVVAEESLIHLGIALVCTLKWKHLCERKRPFCRV